MIFSDRLLTRYDTYFYVTHFRVDFLKSLQKQRTKNYNPISYHDKFVSTALFFNGQ